MSNLVRSQRLTLSIFAALYVPPDKIERIFLIHPMTQNCLLSSKKMELPCSDLSGTKEVVVNVDDDGVISLNFECDQMSPNSKFVWSKNYEPIEDDSRLDIDSKGGK